MMHHCQNLAATHRRCSSSPDVIDFPVPFGPPSQIFAIGGIEYLYYIYILLAMPS